MLLRVVLLLPFACVSLASDATPYVYPGQGSPRDRPVWGLQDGIQIGLAPTEGPAGLIRIYAPYLGQSFPRVVNYLSIEPLVAGDQNRGQSELEKSRDRPGDGKRGLTFWATDALDQRERSPDPVTGTIDPETGMLHVFIHTEPFENGARPVVECVFDPENPEEIALRVHAATGSATMERCTISATMGNYGLLRQIHLADDISVHARDLWDVDAPLDRLNFLPWRTFPPEKISRLPDGRYHVEISTDIDDPAAVEYEDGTESWWKYVGEKAAHYWRSPADANPEVSINGRRTFWKSKAPIPGGVAFENFELNLPFRSGQQLWFGVRPDPVPSRHP